MHEWEEWVEQTAPSCIEAGSRARACRLCDATETESIPALGHDLVTDPAVTPTCTETGLTEGFHCSRCEHRKAQEVIPTLGHDLVTDPAVAPTCTETGLTEGFHCSRCEHRKAQEIIPALGHDLVTDPAVAPTCTETGLTEGFHCSRCEHRKEQKVIRALGHRMGTTVREAVVPATCAQPGSYDLVTYCDNCQVELSRESMVLSPTGKHTAGDVVRENEIPAQPGVYGSYEDVTYCTVCGVEMSRQTMLIPALPQPAYNAWKTCSAEDGNMVTVPDEAGSTAQRLSVADGNLAYVPTTGTGAVTVWINGSCMGDNPTELTLHAGDTVQAAGGACVFRVQTIRTFREDGSDLWAHVNWVPFGDSITDDGSGQWLCGKAPNKYWRVIAAGTGMNVYDGVWNGTAFAVGGTGYYRADKSNFANRAAVCIPHDADVITVFGSVNDWLVARASHQTKTTIPYALHMTGTSTRLTGVTNPENDTRADGTLAGYINATWEEMHRNAPLAKIVIICPLFYLLDRNQAAHGASGINSAFLSVMKLLKWCYDGWIENRDAADWLSWESFSYDPDQNTWLTDTSVLDTDPNSPNYGGYFDFRQINPSLFGGGSPDYRFADYYTYDAQNRSSSYGHPNDLYNRVYLAPRISDILCGVLGTDFRQLPCPLQCNNRAGTLTHKAQ